MITGTPRFTGITLGEVRIHFLPAPATIAVKAAYVDRKTGKTHGWVTGGGAYGGPVWSPKVHEKLKELQQLLEVELAVRHFEDVQEEGGAEQASDLDDLGIGEHASGQDLEAEQQ